MPLVFAIYSRLIERVHQIDVIDKFSSAVLHLLWVVYSLFKNDLIEEADKETYTDNLTELIKQLLHKLQSSPI